MQRIAQVIQDIKTDFTKPLVHDRDFNTQIIRVHQELERSSSQLEQQTLILDLLVQLTLRYAENPPGLAKLEEEFNPSIAFGHN